MTEAALEITIFTLCYEGLLCEVAPFASAGDADEYALKCLAKCLGVPLTGDRDADWRAVRARYDGEECQYAYELTTSKVYGSAADLIREKWDADSAARAGVAAEPAGAEAR